MMDNLDTLVLSPRNLYIRMEREREKTLKTRSDFASFFIAKLIKENLESPDEESKFVLPENVNVVVEKILSFGQIVSTTIGLKRNDFCKHFCEQVNVPSLELIWLLDVKYDLMDVTSYLMELTLRGNTSNFREQFLSFCCSYLPKNKDHGNCLDMFEKLFETVIITAIYKNTNDPLLVQLKSFSSDVLIEITSWAMMSDVSSTLVDTCFDVQKFIVTEIQSLSIPMSMKKQYFAEQLKYLLSQPSTLSTEQVIQRQEKLSAQNVASPRMQMMNLLIQNPQPVDTLRLVMNLISQQTPCQLNWENILLTITVWQKMYDHEYEAVRYLKDQIKTLMFDGIAQNNQDKMIKSFILARHCSLISPVTFFRYENWYKHMFENELFSPIREAASFTFFAEFLTNWIPIEPPCFLQVQATYWPYIPGGCRTKWNDYVSLAKARVQEYNEIESAMEFESITTPLQAEVDAAIKTFVQTNKTPHAVANLYMFRKQYFINVFLPALLTKPIGVTHTDARLRLIELLNAESKIPQFLYSKYKLGGFKQKT